MKTLFVFVFLAQFFYSKAEPRIEEDEVYSAQPNNAPVTRVYVFGKPVYIRQPYVVPQRNYTARDANYARDDQSVEEILSRPNLFDRRRHRDAYGDDQPRYNTDEAITNENKDGYNNDGSYSKPNPKYPLKQCYTEKSGYMCCNRNLEKLMHDTINKMVTNSWKNCNMQTMGNNLQSACESAFGTDFETVVGVSDFASKIHFYSDYVCKMEREGRVLLVYATPNRHNTNEPYISHRI
ncbi:unnamed protein product [Caenorhabditis angaria]|uniref:Ground-like domain-containing protein n=1 Tax=Caenorhabditis angaria TaxID=860376 RepID=A0A9P1IAZ6_9PELO|nr:unnamed protein product [Caenorhabditis angaria]